MFQTATIDHANKAEFYRELAQQLEALLTGESDMIANAANTSALMFQMMPDLNWAGFYRFDGTELVLGPFQGKVACVRIPFGRGVCGTTAVKRETVVVADVHAFPGHIACDAASNSEIVLPVIQNGELIGVFDIDSPETNRFSDADRIGLEKLVARFAAMTDKP